MTPENTKKLYDAFPRLYRGRFSPLDVSLMSCGFECNDGWFDLIWKLSQEIEHIARQEGRNPDSADWPEATQVKEKLGSLRFHLSRKSRSSQMMELIDKARAASEKICEECGNPGAIVRHHGIQVLCADHERHAIKHRY